MCKIDLTTYGGYKIKQSLKGISTQMLNSVKHEATEQQIKSQVVLLCEYINVTSLVSLSIN